MIIRRARADERDRLFDIWHEAVQTTHDFLAEEDRRHIAELVRDAYLPAANLWVAADAFDRPLAFMGMGGSEVESLFVDPAVHGQGIGRLLIEHARREAGPLRVDVNEQNPEAIAFYRHMGFRQVGRSPIDGGGRPYSLIHMTE